MQSATPQTAPTGLADLAALLAGRRLAVLTGAGCSTESGIPDYRGPETRRRARNPMEYREFVSSEAARCRYWARSVVGWPTVGRARPNPAHLALARLEAAGHVAGLVTQNVDRLHHAAGSRDVVELHGALARVRCLACGSIEARDDLQRRLLADNPSFRSETAELAPDGDAELGSSAFAGFRVPGCLACGGVLKPDVVFFGESVPRPVVDAARAAVDAAEALLVVGTSLAVYSGLRFVRQAAARGIPVALVNLGPPSRGAELAAVHVELPAGVALPALAALLGT